ncbi:MAG: tRNA 2-selenouridine(34) synthase MnmH [archaeon]
MVKVISIEKAIKLNPVFIDTRSPKEFEEDNIPESINSPIFTNEERKEIGILYKKNKEQAFDKGFAIYKSKVNDFINEYKEINKKKTIIVYCWRGGIRSKTITELIESLGYEVFQLKGGYKSFRAYIRNQLEQSPPFKLIVLQGLAGCGKTDLIKKLKPSIDLEGLAKHRSSVFGAIGLKPTTQKMFESRLWEQLNKLKKEKTVFIEGEAKKIGNIYVPNKLFKAMQESKTILITCSIKNRAKRIVRDYFTHGEDKKIKEIISSLKVQLSSKVVEELTEKVDKKDYLYIAEYLLLNYYDDKYNHANQDIKYHKEVNNDDVNKAVKELMNLRL